MAKPIRRFASFFDPAALEAINRQANAAVTVCADVSQRGYCTSDWVPRAEGDCKQFAAVKLAMFIKAGARPSEFTIWIVRKPGAKLNHAVLIHNPTGSILDVPGPWVCGTYGCTRSNAITTREVLERRGTKFLQPCDACAQPAIASASKEN